MTPLYCARCKNAFCSRALLAKHVCTPPDAAPKTEEVEDETVSDNEQTTDSVESENEKKLRIENHQRKPKGGDNRESYAPKADLTAHDEQTHATNRVTAIDSEILSIRAEVSNMKSVLHAMEAAQVGDACPPGFDGRKFALLTSRQQRNEEQFDKDIRAKEDDIRRKEEDIRKFQDDIRGLWQQEVGQRPKPHQSGCAQQSNLRNMQDAFDAISQQPDAPTPESVELSMAVKRCNVTATTNGLIGGVRILMKGFVEPCDQAFVPLMCVLGTSGQGKTDTLNFIRRDAIVHALVIEEINEHIKLMKARRSCKHVVPLFATFNQSRTFNGEKEPTIGSALCNRLLSNYLGVIFDPRQSPRFDYITLRGLTEFIRQREATERRCTPAEISIIILVDEMQKVMKGAERDDMMDLLKLICTAQHVALINSATKDLTFAVVSSVDVYGIHDRVDKCGRPLHSIPLSPCSVEDIDDMVDTMVDFEVQNNNLEPMAAGDARRELRWAAHATGGHFRSLEKLWLAFRENPFHFTQAQAVLPAPRTSANILDVIAHRLHDPLWLREETIRIGAAFSKQGVSMTLYDAAVSDVEGVFYEATDAKWGAVVPRVMPSGLSERLPFEGDTDVAQDIVKLWGKMRKLLTSVGRADATNGWELGLPLLEVIASTLIHEVNGKKPVGFGDVWRGAFVQHWAGREAKLFYRPLGSDCASVIKTAMTTGDSASDERMDASDEALREACWNGVPTLRRAENSRHSSFMGLHTLLEEPAPCSARRPVSVVFQMKAQRDVRLEMWALAAHADAKARLGVTDGTYFVVLYDVSNRQKVDGWKSCIPEGTIVIEREALVKFLSPFGMTPLLRILDTHTTEEL